MIRGTDDNAKTPSLLNLFSKFRHPPPHQVVLRWGSISALKDSGSLSEYSSWSAVLLFNWYKGEGQVQLYFFITSFKVENQRPLILKLIYMRGLKSDLTYHPLLDGESQNKYTDGIKKRVWKKGGADVIRLNMELSSHASSTLTFHISTWNSCLCLWQCPVWSVSFV